MSARLGSAPVAGVRLGAGAATGMLGGSSALSSTPATLAALAGVPLVERIEPAPGVGMAPIADATVYYEAVPLTGTLTDRTVYAVVTVGASATGSQTLVDASSGRTKVGFDGGNAWVAFAGVQPPASNNTFVADKGLKFVITARFLAAGGQRVYRNGVLVATSAATTGTISGELRIGGRAFNFEAWTGLVHALHFYDVAHTDTVHDQAAAWLRTKYGVTT